MKHVGTQRLETERLVLRKFQEGDGPSMFKNWASDDQVTVHLTWPTHQSVETSQKVLGFWLEGYERLDNYQWGIVVKASGELIGSIGLVHMDETNEACEIGYCIGRKYWGQGITSEALKAVIHFLFDQVEPERIYAFYHADNPGSGRVMEKAGMEYEGRLRHYRKKTSGEFVDCLFYSVLKSSK